MPMKIDSRLPIKTTVATDKTSATSANNTTPKPGSGLALTAGTIVKGTVLEITGDGKALLDIGGRTVTAQTMVVLEPGSELLLEVKEGGATPWLALAGKKGAAQEIVRLLLTEGANLAKAVTLFTGTEKPPNPALLPASLLEALNSFRQEVGARATGGQAETDKLRQLLTLLRPTGRQPSPDNSLDRRLSTTLEQLATQLDSNRSPTSELKTMAKFLDAHQQLNARQPGNPPDFLLFPCFFAGNAGWGEWLFQMEDGGKGEDKQTTCAIDFFLQMSRLGDVHLKVFLQGEGLRGDFFVAKEAVRSHLTNALPQLVTILEGHGYQPVSLTVRQSTENLLHSFKKGLEEKTNLRSFTLIDVTA